jgi:hypothetical protein
LSDKKKNKFRGKRASDRRLIYGDLVHFNGVFIVPDSSDLMVPVPIIAGTESQCTGFCDLNGDAFYEGDHASCNGCRFVIEYKAHYGAFMAFNLTCKKLLRIDPTNLGYEDTFKPHESTIIKGQ